MDISDIQLSTEQQQLFELFEKSSDHMFITGRAGTGKSVLLQYCKQKSLKKLVVVAPTGVAALNVGASTIHSLFKIPPEFIAPNSLKLDSKTAIILKNIDAVIIDEISMVRADLMDAIDWLLRQARKSSVPFGGVQLVMFGDLYQLSPIVSDQELRQYFAENHGGHYFFNAHAWQEAPLNIYELNTIFRQSDEHFKHILNAVRAGTVDYDTLEQLNFRAESIAPDKGVITLAPTNQAVNQINAYHLAQLNGTTYTYKAYIEGSFERSSFPTDEVLELKVGAQVMLLKNDAQKRWVNGTVGHIESLGKEGISVKIGGTVHKVNKESWSKIRYSYNRKTGRVEEDLVSSFTQFPLRLAWAITIHKSQGQTYDAVKIALGSGAFAHGQTYVALSRCRTLEGVYLERPVQMRDIIVETPVIEFMNRIKT